MMEEHPNVAVVKRLDLSNIAGAAERAHKPLVQYAFTGGRIQWQVLTMQL